MYHLDATVGGHRLRCRLTYSKIVQIEEFFAKEYPDIDNAWTLLLTAISHGEMSHSGLVKLLEICMVDRPKGDDFNLGDWFEKEADLNAPFTLVVQMLEAALRTEKKDEAAADATISRRLRNLLWGFWVGRLWNWLMQRYQTLKTRLKAI